MSERVSEDSQAPVSQRVRVLKDPVLVWYFLLEVQEEKLVLRGVVWVVFCFD